MATTCERREFLLKLLQLPCSAVLLSVCGPVPLFADEKKEGYDAREHYYGMGIQVDKCIGCRYCIQACPYGARYLDPRTKTADKCTFCYHRITKGLLPACVEVCPTQARVFGELKAMSSPLRRLMRMSNLQVLKPYLNTEPKV